MPVLVPVRAFSHGLTVTDLPAALRLVGVMVMDWLEVVAGLYSRGIVMKAVTL